jgi:toxin HigB-1
MIVIQLTKQFEKDAQKAPQVIMEKVYKWMKQVEDFGLFRVRLSKALHDEPLKGKRKGQRSVRLNQQWRLIYDQKTSELLELLEVTPHDY